MSVYIKGMEMPTSCRACPLKMNCDDCEGWECVCVPLHKQIGYLDDLLTDKRRDDCPLVPVPPHGRLIDADKLRHSHCVECTLYPDNCLGDECDWDSIFHIDHAPTIIPADPAKEGEG